MSHVTLECSSIILVPKFEMSGEETKPNLCKVIYHSAIVDFCNAQQFANGMRGNSTGVLSNMVFIVLGKMDWASILNFG